MKNLFLTTAFAGLFFICSGQRQHLLFESTFDVSLSGWDSILQCAGRQQISHDTTLSRKGRGSVKFSVLRSDTASCSPLRAVIAKTGSGTPSTVWYGFSFYAKDYPQFYDGVESILKIYSRPGEGAWEQEQTALSIDYHGQLGYLTATQVLRSPDSVYQQSPLTIYHWPIKPVAPNVWHDVVIQAKWAYDTSGSIKIWLNGELRFNYHGVTINALNTNHVRAGVDKMDWKMKWSNISATAERIMYIDEFRLGDSLASYVDVSPEGAAALPITDNRVGRRRERLKFRVYNPSKNGLMIAHVPSNGRRMAIWEIVNAAGQVFSKGTQMLTTGDNEIKIFFSGASGVYFFIVQTDTGMGVVKFLN